MKLVNELVKEKCNRTYTEKVKWTPEQIVKVMVSPLDFDTLQKITGREKNSINFKVDQIRCLIARKAGVKMGFDNIDIATQEMFEILYATNSIHPDYFKSVLSRLGNKIEKVEVSHQDVIVR